MNTPFISDWAKDLVKKLLTRNVPLRLDSGAILDHPWINRYPKNQHFELKFEFFD